MIRRISCAVAIWIASTGALSAQEGQAAGLSDFQTQTVVTSISEMFDACRPLPEPYLPDCVNHALRRGAGRISNNPGYWEAHVALTRATRSLHALVRENEDRSADRQRVEGFRLRAVTAAALPALGSRAGAVFDRALRDLDTGVPMETPHFERIAQVLRSERPWP